MSVEQDAKAAAELEYPVDLYTSAREAKPQRVPYAQGYIAGFAAALVDLPAALDRVVCTACEDGGIFVHSTVGSRWVHKNPRANHHSFAPEFRP